MMVINKSAYWKDAISFNKKPLMYG